MLTYKIIAIYQDRVDGIKDKEGRLFAFSAPAPIPKDYIQLEDINYSKILESGQFNSKPLFITYGKSDTYDKLDENGIKDKRVNVAVASMTIDQLPSLKRDNVQFNVASTALVVGKEISADNKQLLLVDKFTSKPEVEPDNARNSFSDVESIESLALEDEYESREVIPLYLPTRQPSYLTWVYRCFFRETDNRQISPMYD